MIGEKESGGTFLDYDNDGWWDLVGSFEHPSLILREAWLLHNDQGAGWTRTKAFAGIYAPIPGRSLLGADLNNDGAVDFVHFINHEVDVFVNQGPPSYDFVRKTFAPPKSAEPSTGGVGFIDYPNSDGAGIIDLDGDGWLDLLVPSGGTRNEFMVNAMDGAVEFTTEDHSDRGLSPSGPNADAVALADWDLDGDIDVVIRSSGIGGNAFLSEPMGTPRWVEAVGVELKSVAKSKGGVAFCDLGDDGTMELLWTSEGAPWLSVLAWDGVGFVDFADPPAPPAALRSIAGDGVSLRRLAGGRCGCAEASASIPGALFAWLPIAFARRAR